jgi:hypothetical protein
MLLKKSFIRCRVRVLMPVALLFFAVSQAAICGVDKRNIGPMLFVPSVIQTLLGQMERVVVVSIALEI